MIAHNVTSKNGRRWLKRLSSAKPIQHQNADDPAGFETDPNDGDAELVADFTPIIREPDFPTKRIVEQFQGINGQPAPQDIASIKIPEMNDSSTNQPLTNYSNMDIRYVKIPDMSAAIGADQSPDLETLPSSPDQGAQLHIHKGEASPVMGDAKTEIESAPQANTESEIEQFVDQILMRFPLAAPRILLFAGAETNPRVEETCAKVAASLASRHIGKILLVDSDRKARKLSVASSTLDRPGLTEAIAEDADWAPMMVTQARSSLAFLPSGSARLGDKKTTENLRKISSEMKRDFQFVCVSAGDAHLEQAKMWCDVCDGSYLVISMKTSHQAYAQSAVNEIQDHGGRLIGCVVADVE